MLVKVVLLAVLVIAFVLCAYSLYRYSRNWHIRSPEGKVNPWFLGSIISFIGAILAALGVYQTSKKTNRQEGK